MEDLNDKLLETNSAFKDGVSCMKRCFHDLFPKDEQNLSTFSKEILNKVAEDSHNETLKIINELDIENKLQKLKDFVKLDTAENKTWLPDRNVEENIKPQIGLLALENMKELYDTYYSIKQQNEELNAKIKDKKTKIKQAMQDTENAIQSAASNMPSNDHINNLQNIMKL